MTGRNAEDEVVTGRGDGDWTGDRLFLMMVWLAPGWPIAGVGGWATPNRE